LRAINTAIHDKFAKLWEVFHKNNPGKTMKDFTFKDITIDYQGKEVTTEDLALNPFEFSVEEDKLYAFCLFKYTFGYWEITRNEVRNNTHFLYNWGA
jgi:hypothetical protein